MNNTQHTFTVKQVMVQSLILNGFVTGNDWYVEMVKSIAHSSFALSVKQEAVLDKLIANVSGGSINAATTVSQTPTIPWLPGPATLFDFLRAATKHLKRPHVWIPLDLNKPITQSCDVIKVTFKPAVVALHDWQRPGSERLDLVVRQGGMNTYIGTIATDGTMTFRRFNWVFCKDPTMQNTIISTLTALATDPVTYTSKWGKMLSRCCYCWLPLSTPESLAVGYGPDCAKHYHLPWGKSVGTLTQTQVLVNIARDVDPAFAVTHLHPHSPGA